MWSNKLQSIELAKEWSFFNWPRLSNSTYKLYNLKKLYLINVYLPRHPWFLRIEPLHDNIDKELGPRNCMARMGFRQRRWWVWWSDVARVRLLFIMTLNKIITKLSCIVRIIIHKKPATTNCMGCIVLILDDHILVLFLGLDDPEPSST